MDNSMAKKAGKLKALIVLAIVTTLSLGVYVYRGNEVSLNLDDEVIEVLSYSRTVEEFIQSEKIDFKEGAYINVPLDTELDDNIEITIKNPKTYTIEIDGALTDVVSIYSKVEDILKDADIKLDEDDYSLPVSSKVVAPNSTIELYVVEEIVEVEEDTIPYEEQVIKNKRLDLGITNVIQKGKNGLRISETKNKYINGVLYSSVVVKDEIVEEPVPHVIEKGSKDFIDTSRGETKFSRSVTMTATAYDLSYASTGKTPGDRYYGITASGTKARPGAVAVDPKVIPLGTKLYVQSLDGTKDYGFAIAEDTGGAIKGNKIDLFFNTAKECRNFGRRNVKVFVLQ